jgi:phosphoacetylglucosamine mutase
MSFHLLDGDRIATLAASFLADLVKSCGLGDKLAVGVVQTAYANGASTAYLRDSLKLPVVFTPTGVKHLHHAATRFDVGVYFEANGHGTVLFSAKTAKEVGRVDPKSPAQASSLATLRAVLDLVNQAVGDALSDLLLVEAVLAHRGWTAREWLGTYADLPNRLVRVEVQDRGAFTTTDAERRLEEPRGAQAQIDEMVAKYKDGRAFVRASGTEEAVRVYAEAATRAEADQLATRVADLVRRIGT